MRFGDSSVEAGAGDFEMIGNDIRRFAIGPSTKYMSLALNTASATFEVSWYIEGKNG